MATSYHMEARIKQARLDRWNEQKKRAEFAPQATEKENVDSVSYKQKMDKVITTDPGQFDVVRPKPTSSQVQFETGVIFQSVTHDPNFNYRLGKSLGQVPLHVDRIYKIIYPASFYYAKEESGDTGEKRFKNWNPPKKERPPEHIPRPPPTSIKKIKRDSVYKILHPYEFH